MRESSSGARAPSRTTPTPRSSKRFRFLLLGGPARARLPDAEDDELRGLRRRDADKRDEHSGVNAFGRVGLFVALDEEGLLRLVAHKHPSPPRERQERPHVADDALPEALVVRLEDEALRPLQDGLFKVDEETADVDVAPLGVVRDGARAPDVHARVGELPYDVDALRVQRVLLDRKS